MAEPGLTYYDDRNKVESTLLQTQYIVEKLDKVGTYEPRRIRRIRTKTYSYVGLSRSTAKRCVEDKLNQYTRRYWYWTEERGKWTLNKVYSNSYEACVASIQATRQGGDLYNVEIQVNEETIAYINIGEITNMETFFSYYFGTWNYDE